MKGVLIIRKGHCKTSFSIKFIIKKLLYFLLFLPPLLFSQVTTSPAVPTVNDEITITLTTTGTDLAGYTGDIYAHTGLTVDGDQWQNVIGTWGNNLTQPKLTKITSNTFELIITPDIFTYYSVNTNKSITEISFVFRSSDGSKQTSPDIFIDIFEAGLNVVLTNPSTNDEVFNLNEHITLSAESSLSADLELFVNNISQKSIFETITISSSYTFTSTGTHTIKVNADKNAESVSDEKSIYVKTSTLNLPLPNGVKNGINKNGDGTVTFVLTAPNKSDVFILGDFNDFHLNENHQMNKDGDQFWVTISGLNPNTEYAYQYYIDFEILVADPYSEKVLDPDNDPYIPESTYPNLKDYPTGKTTGIVSTFKINEVTYNWQNTSFAKPDQENLIIYEMLMRDFTDSDTYKEALTHLDYLQDLGVNAIELMPINEFEGNDSWGYNPSFYMALDKAYGTKNDLKEFVDECHKRGIAVLTDVVFNHSYSQSPLLQMYWDPINSRPASNSPYYNENHNFVDNTSAHWGYDFNHETTYTTAFFKDVLTYWMEEYKIDGFRFDFTKGFSNTLYYGANNWGSAYDADRIANLKAYADHVWSNSSGNEAYVIFEHLSDNNEETELANYGMMLWGNMNYNYNENTMGYGDGSKEDISWISYKQRGWNSPHILGYMESHDEERLMYKNIQFGNSNGSYNVKNLNTALSRQELAGNFFFTIPGPKMIWQFGELGYDISIDEGGRLGRKPVHWEYYNDVNRRKIYDVWATLIAFKKEEPAFSTNDFTLNVNTLVKGIVLKHSSMDVVIIGNFDIIAKNINPQFTKTGTWFEYYTGNQYNVTNTTTLINLQPGEYRLYSTKTLNNPLPVDEFSSIGPEIILYPNPAYGYFKLNKSVEKVEVFDVLGRTIKTFLKSRYIDKEYDISALKPAIYIVKISSEFGCHSQRLVLD